MECASVCVCSDQTCVGIGVTLHSADVRRAAPLRVLFHALYPLLLLPHTAVVVLLYSIFLVVVLLARLVHVAKQRIVFVCHKYNRRRRRVETLY